MSILEKHISFVKQQIEFQQKMSERFAGNPFRSKLHIGTRDRFSELLNDILAADSLLDQAPVTQEPAKPTLENKAIQLSLRLEDIQGLPQELIDELSVSDADKTEFAIKSIIDEAGGVLTLDKILIGIYRKTGEIIKRSLLTGRLYRMVQKGALFNVPNKKGLYASWELTTDEVEKLGLK